jgi:hypothetical protein
MEVQDIGCGVVISGWWWWYYLLVLLRYAGACIGACIQTGNHTGAALYNRMGGRMSQATLRNCAASCGLATRVCRAGRQAGSHCMQCLATWHRIIQVCMHSCVKWFIRCSRHQAMLHSLYVLPTLPARIAARLLQLGSQ